MCLSSHSTWTSKRWDKLQQLVSSCIVAFLPVWQCLPLEPSGRTTEFTLQTGMVLELLMHAEPECNVFNLLDERLNMHRCLEDDSCDDTTVRERESVPLTARASLLLCQPPCLMSRRRRGFLQGRQTAHKPNSGKHVLHMLVQAKCDGCCMILHISTGISCPKSFLKHQYRFKARMV